MDYENYQEWTEGYLDVPSMKWLKEFEMRYVDAIVSLLKKYSLYTKEISDVISHVDVSDLLMRLQYEFEHSAPLSVRLIEQIEEFIRRLFFLNEIDKLSFYQYIKNNDQEKETKEVKVISYGPQGMDPDDRYPSLTYRIDKSLKEFGVEIKDSRHLTKFSYDEVMTDVKNIEKHNPLLVLSLKQKD